jgi:hypothetical protein
MGWGGGGVRVGMGLGVVKARMGGSEGSGSDDYQVRVGQIKFPQ